MTISTLGFAAAAVTALALTAPTWGQCQQNRVAPEDVSDGQYFGSGVAMSGDALLVGAAFDSERGVNRGAAYVFRRDGDAWTQETKLLPPAEVLGGSFGLDVDLDGDTALIGAYQDDVDGIYAGAAYVYRYDGAAWHLEATLTAPEPGSGDQFGNDVALDGDVAIVGARSQDEGAGNSGAAHVYRRRGTTWSHEQMLVPEEPEDVLDFGASVAIEGDTAVVGATDSLGPGRVYVFSKGDSAWTLDTTLTSADPDFFDDFGRSVLVEGDVLIATGRDSGVSVFRRTPSTWVLEDVWTSVSSSFGWHIAIDGDTVAVHGFLDEVLSYVVSVRTYDRGLRQWTETARLVPSSDRYFSGDVAIQGSTVAAGLVSLADWSAVYIFDLLDSEGVDCDNNGECDAIEMRLGLDCNENEIHDVCEGLPDTDGDGLFDPCDNCPEHANADQSDCDADGIGDVCAIADGLSSDCNGNGRPDECELDCNRNGSPDDCDIADGTSTDCNGDGRPDECDIAYAVDDGVAEFTVGYPSSPGRTLWMNGFTVAPGERTLMALGVVWNESPAGRPASLLLYEDPNDDGDPNDGHLVLSVDLVTAPSAPDEYTIVPIPPTVIGEAGERFFVAAVVTHEGDDKIIALDTGPARGESWATFLGDDPSDLVDLDTLEQPLYTDVGVTGNWMLRAYAGVGGVTCGDVDGDGVVDGGDLLGVLSAWGPCPTPCPPACAGDLDGTCAVDFEDLLIVIANWAP